MNVRRALFKTCSKHGVGGKMMNRVWMLTAMSLVSLGVISGCKDKTPDNSHIRVNSDTSESRVARTTPSFGAEQDDPEGYGGHLWGSRNIQELKAEGKMWNYNLFLKAVGPPGDVERGFFVQSTNYRFYDPNVHRYCN
jgi:hypothetical protein